MHNFCYGITGHSFAQSCLCTKCDISKRELRMPTWAQNSRHFMQVLSIRSCLFPVCDRAFGTQHCADVDHTTRPLLLVTASVDKISLLKPLLLDEDLRIGGAVAWVGRSSMEIRMEVIQPVTGNSHQSDKYAPSWFSQFGYHSKLLDQTKRQ